MLLYTRMRVVAMEVGRKALGRYLIQLALFPWGGGANAFCVRVRYQGELHSWRQGVKIIKIREVLLLEDVF